MKKKLKTSRNRHASLEFWMRDYLENGHVNIIAYMDKGMTWAEASRAGWGAFDWREGRIWGVADKTPLAIELAWKILQREILDAWIAERPFSRPWAFWFFADPQRGENESEIHYLKSHDLLTKQEKVLLNKGVI